MVRNKLGNPKACICLSLEFLIVNCQAELKLFVHGGMFSNCLKTEDLSESKVFSAEHPYRATGTYVFKLKSLAAECKHSTK